MENNAILDFARNNPTVLNWAFQILFAFAVWILVDRVESKKRFYDLKPYISVNPYFIKDPLPHSSGRIEYIEIGNFGKSVATDVVIEFFYTRIWDSPYVEEKISISGKYKIKYLPPSPIKKYNRPYTRYSIPEDWFPEIVRVSYVFQGRPVRPEYFVLVEKDIEDRGLDLVEIV